MAERDASTQGSGRGRRAYHHGDLRNALTQTAVELARKGGPDAVVLREVARGAGVSSAAAYRHFANHQDLVHEVKATCLDGLAARMRADIAAQEALPDLGDDAIRRLYVIGESYVRFALEEPGLFRTIFRGMLDAIPGVTDEEPGPHDDLAFLMMVAALDDLVAAGRITPEARAMSDIALWSAVHGLSLILIDTPMSVLPPVAKDMAIQRVLDVSIRGVLA